MRTVSEEKRLVEDALESYRPRGSHRRLQVWYACGSPAEALHYLEAENYARAHEIKLYRIEMVAPSRHPMCLVDAVKKSLASREIIKSLVDEYWTPKLDWNYWEYISPQMRIIEQVVRPDDVELSAVLYKYSLDGDEVKKRWLRHL